MKAHTVLFLVGLVLVGIFSDVRAGELEDLLKNKDVEYVGVCRLDANGILVFDNKRAKTTPECVVGAPKGETDIKYNKTDGVALVFMPSETRIALLILKAIYQGNPADFIGQAISDIEADLQPKQLPTVNYFHICEKCLRDLDERNENAICVTRDDDIKWQHRECPPLKSNRP